jgi:hypothetical protein
MRQRDWALAVLPAREAELRVLELALARAFQQ